MRLLPLLVLPLVAAALFAVNQGGFLQPSLPRVFYSSQADPSPRGSIWWVGAYSTDSSALPNTGVRGTITVISSSTPDVLDFWVSDDLSNNVWGQVGYYIEDGATPVAFYQVWNLSADRILDEGVAQVTTGTHLFAMYLSRGTTWAFSLDGWVFGSYDMGASESSSSYRIYALSEEQAPRTFSFPAVTFGPALQVLKSGEWTDIAVARSYGTAWGLEGASQGSSMTGGEIVVGASLSSLSPGTQLWGPSPPASAAAAPPTSPRSATVNGTTSAISD